jgi:hypothetical protein
MPRTHSLVNRGTGKELTTWSRVLLKKLTSLQLVKKFPKFYGTRRFISAFTRAHQLSLPWTRSTQYTAPHPYLLKIYFNIIFLSTPKSSKWSLPLRFLHQDPVCTSPISHTCHIPAHCILSDHPNNIW